MNKARNIVWFDQVSKSDISLAGGKGANLGELTKAGVPVPPGFIVTAQSYFDFLKESKLANKIRSLLSPLDPDDGDSLQQVSDALKDLINAAAMPRDTARAIAEAYKKMGAGPVAVRSSGTAEDLPEASFAGQQRTFLNVEGSDDVIAAVKGCWASLYEARAIFYRAHRGFDHIKVGIAVPVQRMVQSEVSGVLFTLDPINSDQSKVVMEAIYGLGEAIVSGELTPDLYIVDKRTMKIVERTVAKQEWLLVRNKESRSLDATNVKIPVIAAKQEQQKLSDDDIVLLAQLGKKIEELYEFPQDIEWAKEGKSLYIVQARPVTTIRVDKRQREFSEEAKKALLLSGAPASPGIGYGPVKIALQATELDRVKKNDVLVADMTTPDFVPAMKRAAAIVTERGGRTCHAAIVSRELGIPCVVGAGSATKILQPEQMITVDGYDGKIYKGRIAMEEPAIRPKTPAMRIKTTTKLYINLAEPELADTVASRDVDGVGLLRAEFMVAQIGEHPRYMIAHGRGAEFVDKLSRGVERFAKAFNPRPVVYRTTDFKTNEYRNLKGGEEFEEVEENPMLGYRGCSRYLREPDVFELEVEVIKRVRDKYKNLWVMIPFVRKVRELSRLVTLLKKDGLSSSDDFKLWMMVEVPSNILLLDEFIDVGIDGISIGSNDLTQLTLGIDRDSPKLADEFDERDDAVLVALEKVIKTSVRKGVTVSICGQAPSVYPDLTYKLVKWGITSVSVSPDAIEETREIIAKAEGRLERPSLRRRVARQES